LEYVAVCLELNLSARGEDLVSAEKNLRAAIELYLDDVREHPETVVSPITIEEFVGFLRETEPDWYKDLPDDLILKPLEVHAVPSYA
jgi:predicted RNase H-like HicB family nuclease